MSTFTILVLILWIYDEVTSSSNAHSLESLHLIFHCRTLFWRTVTEIFLKNVHTNCGALPPSFAWQIRVHIIWKRYVIWSKLRQDDTPPHYANPLKRFLMSTFAEYRLISQSFDIACPPQSLKHTLLGFWLLDYNSG